MSAPPPLRRHQREAREALARHWSTGANRAWVVLLPGASKTLVGLLEGRDHPHGHVVVLGPNTAVVGQWLAGASELGLEVGGERGLSAPVTALTYQSLAVFDPDSSSSTSATTCSRCGDGCWPTSSPCSRTRASSVSPPPQGAGVLAAQAGADPLDVSTVMRRQWE